MSITLDQVLKAYEYADSHPHKYLRGTTNWCAAVAHALNVQQPAPVAAQIIWSDVEPWYLANEQRLSDIRKFEGPKGFALEVWRGARLNGMKP